MDPAFDRGIEANDRLAELAAEAGVTFVDAPVMGSRQPAEAGQLTVLASGPDEALDRVQPVFDAIGARTKRLGPAGNGTRFKLVTNAWVVTLNSGIAEALTLARGFDLRPEDVLETIAGGPLDSGYAQMKAGLMLGGEFEPAFPLKHARKDARLALAASDRELPVLEGVARAAGARRGARLRRRGHGRDDLRARRRPRPRRLELVAERRAATSRRAAAGSRASGPPATAPPDRARRLRTGRARRPSRARSAGGRTACPPPRAAAARWSGATWSTTIGAASARAGSVGAATGAGSGSAS